MVAADNISIVPSIKYVNLETPSTISYSIASTSPNTAAATALQISTSNPLIIKLSSSSNISSEKPGNSSLVPHITAPLSITL